MIFDEVNAFVTDSLHDYLSSIDEYGISKEKKDVFDYVWKTITLQPAEILIIDSPLIQRLRRIRQLGLASLVYCNADYSRFSHTLGVVELSGRMADVVDSKLGKNGETVFDFPEIVRLAAIFHDAGHLLFSHVSETYFAKYASFKQSDSINYDIINNAILHFNKQVNVTVAFHELISIMIVNADYSRKLFNLVKPHFKSRITNPEELDLLIDYISCLIIGVPNDKKLFPFHAIINGIIDADKLDYFSRDSESTKVPIAVDIARLIQKIEVVDDDEKNINKSEIWNDFSPLTASLKVMGIKFSAQRVFWQFTMARSILYESIYYHQKVSTAEEMLRQNLNNIFNELKNFRFRDILMMSDDSVGIYVGSILFPGKESPEVKEIISLSNRIANRQLYKRVFSLSIDNLTGINVKAKNFLRDIIGKKSPDESNLLIQDLKKEYADLRRLMGYPEIKTPPNFLFVEAKTDSKENDRGIPIEYGNGEYKKSSEVFKDEPWMKGKQSKTPRHFLTTDQSDRDIVCLAFEKVLYKTQGLRVRKEAYMCAKFKSGEIVKKRSLLFEKGYYDDALILLSEDLFENKIIRIGSTPLDDNPMYSGIIKKYQVFSGVDGCKVDENTLKSFLKQFLRVNCSKADFEILMNGTLLLLNRAIFVDRPYFVQNCERLLHQIKEKPYKNRYLIRLGGLFDSANHLSYYFNDIEQKKNYIFCEDINTALDSATDNDVLVFFDDGAYSGSQVISIFQEMFGIENRMTKEHHVDKLYNQSLEKLKRANIILAYLCFNSDSKKHIQEELHKVGCEKVEIAFIKDLNIKLLDSENEILPDPKQRETLKKIYSQIGRELMESSKTDHQTKKLKEGWDDKRVSEAALGYNDSQQMVIFDTNVPTYTMVPFWQEGKYKGEEWKGLFKRTKKD